jgi:MoaA/NifB/PqqE/SkfB family radical SAM enzyme
VTILHLMPHQSAVLMVCIPSCVSRLDSGARVPQSISAGVLGAAMTISMLGSLAAMAVVGVGAYLIGRAKSHLSDLRSYKVMGLKLFLPRGQCRQRVGLEELVEQAKGGGTILMVGRTLRSVLDGKRALITEGVKHGVGFRFLIINPAKVREKSITLAPLQLDNPDLIENDLVSAVRDFVHICTSVAEQKYQGSVDVRTCDFLIFNSLVCMATTDKLKLLLDFSFGDAEEEKYQQYYECSPAEHSHFCAKLYRFYVGLFDQSSSYITYTNGELTYSEHHIEASIRGDIERLLEQYAEYEELRNNAIRHFLHRVPNILSSKLSNSPAPPPVSVQLELTNKCDSACQHCRRHTWPETQEMPLSDVINVIDDLADAKVRYVTISGGEPLLREDLEQILKRMRSKGLNIGILTNGLHIDRESALFLTKHAAWIRISMDGSNPEVYGKVRGAQAGFHKVMQAIKYLAEANRRLNGRCKLGICYSIQTLNIEDIEGMIALAGGMPLAGTAKRLTLKFVHGRNGFLCTEAQLAKFRDEVLSRAEPDWEKIANIGYLHRFLTDYSSVQDIGNGTPLHSYYTKNNTCCFTPYLFSLIDASGDVYPCCFLYHDNDSHDEYSAQREAYRIGRIPIDGPLSTIWNSDKYNDLRQRLGRVDVSQFPECAECSRHCVHNAFLTALCSGYQTYARDFHDAGPAVFRKIAQEYPARDVWL